MMMRASLAGDQGAYRALLQALAPVLRAAARQNAARMGLVSAETEDIVQETLLAIHLKRQTWQTDRPIGPWIRAILRHKIIDVFRRRRIEEPIEDWADRLPSPEERPGIESTEVTRHLRLLPDKQQMIVRAIALEGASIAEAAQRANMTEGAVRVALHRGLANLAAKLRDPK